MEQVSASNRYLPQSASVVYSHILRGAGVVSLTVVSLAILYAHQSRAAGFQGEEWPTVSMLLSVLPMALSAFYFKLRVALLIGIVFTIAHLSEWIVVDGDLTHPVHGAVLLGAGLFVGWIIKHQKMTYGKAWERDRRLLQEHKALLDAVNTLSISVSATTDVSVALRMCLETSVRTLRVKGGLVHRLAPETGRLVLVYARGVDAAETPPLHDMAIGEGVIGHVAATRTVCTDADAATPSGPVGSRFAPILSYSQRPALAWCGVPLLVNQELVGVLTLLDSRPRVLSADEVSFLKAICSSTALAVERAKLLDAVEQESQRADVLERDQKRAMQQFEATILGCAAKFGMSRVEKRFPFLTGSSGRVTTLAVRLAESLGVPGAVQQHISAAAGARDSGLLTVPEGLLLKETPLTEQERDTIRRHPFDSVRFFMCFHVVAEAGLAHVLMLIRHHHENWDGTGYPDGLRGEQIPLGARILAVADAYDALTHDRPHRRAYTPEEARRIINEGAGRQWDPTVAAALMDALELAPVNER